jgi:Domain of unknown function DUF29
VETPLVLEPIALTPPIGAETLAETLYEQDFFLWTQAMVEALRSGKFSTLDIENLAEEVESLGRRDRRELTSRLTTLLMHLLKWQFQPEMQSGSWRGTLAEQRLRIRRLLQDSPSLRLALEGAVDECYEDAKLQASAETGLPVSMFPATCPYPMVDVLNVEFLPD